MNSQLRTQSIINGTNVTNHKEYVIWRKAQDETKLLFFRANFFPVFAETLYSRLGIRTHSVDSKGTDSDHCSDRYANVYDMIVDNQRTRWEHWTGLSKKYLNDMKYVQPIFKKRNLVAHQSHAEIAKLLVDPVFAEHQQDEEIKWSKYYAALFAYVYKHPDGSPMTLKQCASLSEEHLAARILKSETPKPDLSQKPKLLGEDSNGNEDVRWKPEDQWMSANIHKLGARPYNNTHPVPNDDIQIWLAQVLGSNCMTKVICQDSITQLFTTATRTSPSPSPSLLSAQMSTSSSYAHLITLLHPSPPLPFEIEVLPPSHPPHILSSPPSLGIPPKLLLANFLHARHIFHSAPRTTQKEKDEILGATKILTLWEPNWGSAWAFRKRCLLASLSPPKKGDGSDPEVPISNACRTEKIEDELAWTEVLLKSPLCGKHAKSVQVWSHRRWVISTFSHNTEGVDVKREIEIVMVAGERHARNYYAWEYAREVVRSMAAGGKGKGKGGWYGEVVGMVHQWCLMHPRDISGWAFLVFLLERNTMHQEAKAREIFRKTRDFVEKFGWKGESVEWFLKSESSLLNSQQ
ncbi:MAG: hypothetical protein Q9221_007233 [Calogaya cf. arnoldii]